MSYWACVDVNDTYPTQFVTTCSNNLVVNNRCRAGPLLALALTSQALHNRLPHACGFRS